MTMSTLGRADGEPYEKRVILAKNFLRRSVMAPFGESGRAARILSKLLRLARLARYSGFGQSQGNVYSPSRRMGALLNRNLVGISGNTGLGPEGREG